MSRYRLAILTRPGRGLGLRLAGAVVEEVAEDAVAERLKAILEEPGLGVLGVEEDLLLRVPEPLRARAERRGVPLLLPFSLPANWGEAGRGEAYVAALIRRAIGYHAKVQR